MFDKVSWLLVLDNDVDGEIAHETAIDIGLENCYVMTPNMTASVALITGVSSEDRINSKVEDETVHYSTAFLSTSLTYCNPGGDNIETLLGEETDWNVFVCTSNVDFDFLGFMGDVLNALVLPHPEDNMNLRALQEITTEKFMFLPASFTDRVPFTVAHLRTFSKPITRRLFDRSGEILLSPTYLSQFSSDQHLVQAKRRTKRLRLLFKMLDDVDACPTIEDMKFARVRSMENEVASKRLLEVLSEWKMMQRQLNTEEEFGRSLEKIIDRIRAITSFDEIPIACMPSRVGLETLIFLVHEPKIADNPECILGELRKIQKFQEKFSSFVDDKHEVSESKDIKAVPPPPRHVRRMSKSSGAPVSLRPGGNLSFRRK